MGVGGGVGRGAVVHQNKLTLKSHDSHDAVTKCFIIK